MICMSQIGFALAFGFLVGFTLLLLIITFDNEHKLDNNSEKRAAFILIFCFVGCPIIATGVGIYSGLIDMNAQPQERTIEIYSLGDTMASSGRFTLGSGYVDSYPCFMFYKKTNDGGFNLASIPAYKTTIYQDENEKPYIKQIIEACSPCNECNAYTEKYEVHIPSNSIVESYKLDSN